MMSLSDKVKDEFQPLNLSALEVFDEEKSNQGKNLEPDWEKFKVFFEDLKAEQKETDIFKEMFEKEREEKKKEKIVFEQFGEKKAESGLVDIEEPDKGYQEKEIAETGKTEYEVEEIDAQTDEEDQQNIEKPGYDQGYEQGLENGEKDGYEKGFEKGKIEGHEQGSKEGFSEGYAKGELEAEKDGKIKFTEKVEAFEKVLSKLDNTYFELAERYETKIISLVCKIAEKVVLAKIEIDEGIIKETILDALNTLSEPEDITLSVSEEDYEYIEMVKDDLFDSVKSLKSVSVKSDASVTLGGCRIETKDGYIETDIESKLEKIFSIIKGKDLI